MPFDLHPKPPSNLFSHRPINKRPIKKPKIKERCILNFFTDQLSEKIFSLPHIKFIACEIAANEIWTRNWTSPAWKWINLGTGLNTIDKHNSWLNLVYIKTIRFEPNHLKIRCMMDFIWYFTRSFCRSNRHLNFLHVCAAIWFEEALSNHIQSNYNSNVKLIWSTFHR